MHVTFSNNLVIDALKNYNAFVYKVDTILCNCEGKRGGCQSRYLSVGF